jgi:dTDP-4-amino-4,6-dideoxygalactose transaminase
MPEDKIFVTMPSLPPIKEFTKLLEDIWESKILTNKGKYHDEFENRLAEYLGVQNLSIFSNGTLALICALQVLRITGEVITTPFSFVATTHALHWNGIKPVFCDIDLDTFTLDPNKIESLITPKTTALLPVHVYGNPCHVGKLEEIADIYGLKTIYDSAHAFGVKVGNQSIVEFGDLSVLSFHATKVFNTIEGGAIICHDKKTKKRIDNLKNFGFANETTVVAPGINAKMNELQAAYGLLQLKQIDEEIEKRSRLTRLYAERLSAIEGIRLQGCVHGATQNHSYFVILVDPKKYGKSRDQLYEELKANNFYGRRYFYPLISQFPTYRGLPSAAPGNLPVAERIAEQVICLPIYASLSTKIVKKITDIIRK